MGGPTRLALVGPLKPMPRPKGSKNLFGGDDDHQALVQGQYGVAWSSVVAMRKAHVRKKGGCHVCAEAIESRLLGKPPQEIKHTGHKQPPLFLVKMADVKVEVIEQPAALPEGFIEGELVDASVEEAGS